MKNDTLYHETPVAPAAAAISPAAIKDELAGERPVWWWTSITPTQAEGLGMLKNGRMVSLAQVNTATCSRSDVFRYFANGWFMNEVLFSGLQGEAAFHIPPAHGLRHPMIFYYGHTATLFVNKLRVAGLIDRAIDPDFESIFEVGVDEMSWDDMSKNEMTWPSVRRVNQYRRIVCQAVEEIIATHPDLDDNHAPIRQESPLWALFMAMEHERIHFETSSVLVRELPLEYVREPASWPTLSPGKSVISDIDTFQPVPASSVLLGKPDSWPSFGWDNEYGTRQAEVAAFRVSKYMVTNAQFLAFVADNGYRRQEFWSESGWKWRSYRNTAHPSFWMPSGPAGLHQYQLRTVFDVTSFQGDWPVCVNQHEAHAYLAWRAARDNATYRLPTEAEHALLRRGAGAPESAKKADMTMMALDSSGLRQSRYANSALAFGCETSVGWSEAGPFGVHDISGNLWDWCEDDFHPLDGFAVHRLYDDFSVPCFDGEHAMIMGGSFASSGDEASAWARFHFRSHFLQHAGFHVVCPSNTAASGAVRIGAGSASKYDSRKTLDQYLLFHFGHDDDALPAGGQFAGIGHFPQRCAQILIEKAREHGAGFDSALDVGCAVGGASFALLDAYLGVTGVDISEQFIDTARQLHAGVRIAYDVVDEGEISHRCEAAAPGGEAHGPVEFRRADACSLPAKYVGFDGVMAANLLCRLPSPKAFLSRLGGPRGLVKPGGLVMFASPYSWSEQYTAKSAWLGGTVTGQPNWSSDALRKILGGEFDLVHEQDLPMMLREHRRKFEYVVSAVSVWKRRTA